MALAFACASPAWSQAGQAPDRRFEVTLRGSVGYDSNVAKGGQVVQAARNLRKAEITYSPSANVDIAQTFFGQGVYLNGSVGYNFRERNETLESERIGLNGGISTGYGPCGLNIVGGYSRGQSDLLDVDLRVTKNKQTTESIGATVSCAPLVGLGVTAGYNYAQTRNSSELQTQDSHIENATAGITYTNRLVGTVSLSATYARTDYDDTPASLLLAPRGFQQYSGGVSIVRPIGSRLIGQAQISYTSQDTDGGGEGFSGVTGAGVLTYRVNPRLVTTLSYSRGSQASYQQGASFVVNEDVDLSLDYRFSQRLSGSLSGRAAQRSYRGQTVLLPLALLKDESYGVTSSLSLAVGRKSTIGVSGGYEHRDANPSIYDYSAYRVGVSISTTF